MKGARVLILDMEPQNGLADQLIDVLHAVPEVDLRRETYNYDNNWAPRLQIPHLLSSDVTDACFFLVGRRSSSHLREVFIKMSKIALLPPIIAVIDDGETGSVDELLNIGASDFVLPPISAVNVCPRLRRVLKRVIQPQEQPNELKEKLGLTSFIGESPQLMREITKIPAIAGCDATVLILGESGTGKELCARAIHYLGHRKGQAFIAVNCGAIPDQLVENELFGHEVGAFTGATGPSDGVIHDAEGGTLFLDEVDSLPLGSQVKLLRFLQEKEYRRLGSRKVCKSNVRVIAATNAGVRTAVASGRLRQDLYYRLNTITIGMPPLRERLDDIPALVGHFARKYATEFNKPSAEFTPGAIQKLLFHDWPGNIRELENAVARAVLLSGETPILPSDVLSESGARDFGSLREVKAAVVASFERRYVTELLRKHGGNISHAAQDARKHRRAFWQLMRKHRISAA